MLMFFGVEGGGAGGWGCRWRDARLSCMLRSIHIYDHEHNYLVFDTTCAQQNEQ